MSTHTAIATTSKGAFDAIQVPTDTPGPGEILLKTEYSSMIAFDTYTTDLGYAVERYPLVLGFNASGVVKAVGPGVTGLVVNDRVGKSCLDDLQMLWFNVWHSVGYSLCISDKAMQQYLKPPAPRSAVTRAIALRANLISSYSSCRSQIVCLWMPL